MCTICGPQVKEIKIVASLQDISVNNALTLSNGLLQLGGALVKNTDITGTFNINIGTSSNRLIQINTRATNQILSEFNNGLVSNSIKLDSSGILITDNTTNPKGLVGNADYKANYTANSYTQKIYTDSRIVGRAISNLLSNPTITENGFSIIWDNTASQFTLSSAIPGIGTTTQIIFNDGGALNGDSKLLYDKSGIGKLTVNNILIGNSTYAGTTSTISAGGVNSNISLTLTPKGTGELIIDSTSLLFGQLASGSERAITVRGNDSLIHLNLEVKGTEGVVHIGSINEAGANRYIGVRGSVTDINLEIRPKGLGEILIGDRTGPGTLKVLRSSGISPIANLRLANKTGSFIDVTEFGFIFGGLSTPELRIGANTDAGTQRILGVLGSSSNIDLLISAKGDGRVYLNGSTLIELPIGNWNMHAGSGGTSSIPISLTTYGLDWTKIIGIEVEIVDNTNTLRSPLFLRVAGSDFTPSGFYDYNSTDITLYRRTGSFYDSAAYNGTGFSRGTLLIKYKL